MSKGDVYYNKSQSPIYIIANIVPDTYGHAAEFETKYIVLPGQGIDLSILGLTKKRPYKKEKS